MNKKVLKTMITLVIVFLVALYVLKIFFPEQFVMAIQNEKIVEFGKLVDNNLWLHIILGTITSFATYWLYLCAVNSKWKLGYKYCILLIVISLSIQLLYYFVDTSVSTVLGTTAMVCLPAINPVSSRRVGIVFGVHSISQWLSTKIRGLPFMLVNVNYASVFILMCEGYFWLLLLYLYFNYKKGDKDEKY